jgi:FkbM family methyltransferase
MDANLIYDLGMHRGEDTEFYLKKGFRVVAVEADPELCSLAASRFSAEVAAGRLTIVNQAIGDAPGKVTLYKNKLQPIWNTLSAEWAERNRGQGADSIAIEVEATTLDRLMRRLGVPYFLKVDIEGMDLTAIQSISALPDKPRYISLESCKVSFQALKHEFDVLTAIGYRSFKLVAQHHVHAQIPPRPAREGQYVAHRFAKGASGMFGEEAPGQWLTADEAIQAYRPAFLRYALTGDDPFIRNRYLRALLKRIGFRAGWYDTHAKLGS